jgi:hypothetical protein
MSALSIHLDRLFHWLPSVDLEPLTHDVRIVEVHCDAVNPDDGTYHVRRDELLTPSDYEARFEELLRAGYPWLNMSCYGVHQGLLLVAIEVPSPRPLQPGRATSVNLSGPVCIRDLNSVLTIK